MPDVGDYVKADDFEAIKPQLSIRTVTTGAAGTNASASVAGTTPNFKLNLTIPRGNTGATGATGPQGPSGVYTGPLKPTSDYWQKLKITSSSATLPSGVTWAYYALKKNSNQEYIAAVVAGGSVVGVVESGFLGTYNRKIQPCP